MMLSTDAGTWSLPVLVSKGQELAVAPWTTGTTGLRWRQHRGAGQLPACGRSVRFKDQGRRLMCPYSQEGSASWGCIVGITRLVAPKGSSCEGWTQEGMARLEAQLCQVYQESQLLRELRQENHLSPVV